MDIYIYIYIKINRYIYIYILQVLKIRAMAHHIALTGRTSQRCGNAMQLKIIEYSVSDRVWEGGCPYYICMAHLLISS